jgi:hypothetical protein
MFGLCGGAGGSFLYKPCVMCPSGSSPFSQSGPAPWSERFVDAAGFHLGIAVVFWLPLSGAWWVLKWISSLF